jgi:DNA-binding Lrp family transcriptional regulator
MSEEKVRTEEFKVSGDQLLARIKELVHEGNIRRITIRNEEGRTLIDIPLTVGVVGAILVPQLAAIGAIAALLSHATIVLEKVDTSE